MKWIIPACALASGALAMHSPFGMPPIFASIASAAGLVFVDWASILLEAAPFVLAGTAAAAALQRVSKRAVAAPLFALLAPGCDCSMNGFATALSTAKPSVAGFALTWSAACGPAALLATHAALGDRILVARLAGGLVAASATAWLWSFSRQRPLKTARCARHEDTTFAGQLCAALRGLSVAALGAASLAALAPDAIHSMTSAPAAAVIGAVLSPCSTADAMLARVLVNGHASQAAFVIAAQCVDVRQLAMLRRHFGATHMVMGAIAGCAGCVVAALLAR
jgi:uncharacterized membrane protein YraQ (UPF0718 family)